MAFYTLGENDLKELRELSANSIGVLKKEGGFTATQTSRILVIGLGGMGLKTLKNLKAELRDRVGTINSSLLRILSLDTDKKDRETALSTGLLSPEEIPLLDNSAVGGALAAAPEFRPEPVSKIIPNGFGPALSGEGANQNRLAGRLTVMDLNLFNDIYNKIRGAISQLSDFSTKTLDVHVVAGIGGGSGSGMVVDIPYIVRAVVQALGIPESRLRIFGHVYLPNAYSGIPNADAAYRNGYAALKEIEYYMNIDKCNETYDAVYPTPVGEFSSQKPIFTQCTLIGGKIAGAIVMSDPQQKAISVCVENLVNQCTSVTGNVDSGTGSITDFFSSQSFHVNTDEALNVVIARPDTHFPKSGNYNYNFIGSTSIKFPTEAVVSSFIGEMSKKAEALLQNNVSLLKQEAVDAFESNLIKPTFVLDYYTKRLATTLDNILNNEDQKWTKSSILTNAHTVDLENAVTKAVTVFDKDNDFIERCVASANNKAAEIFKDAARGPYYLAALLTCSPGMGGNVHGFFEKITSYNSATAALKEKLIQGLQSIEVQKRELAETMQKLGKFNSNLEKFKGCLKQIYILKFQIRLCDFLLTKYYVDLNQARGVAYRLKDSLDTNFLTYVDIYSEISRIMAQNAANADAKLGSEAVNDPTSIFALNDPEFDALKSTVLSSVPMAMSRLGSDGPQNYAAALTTAMMNNRKEWELTRECAFGTSACAAAYRKFIQNYKHFEDVINRNMLDYFDEAYQGKEDSYKNMVIQKLLDVVSYNAAPMCNVWDEPNFNFHLVKELRYTYLVLPNCFNNEWGNAFKNLFMKDSKTENIYWSPDQNAIYCYTLYAKMPIWIHKDLAEYEQKYEALKGPGTHTNEHPNTKPALAEYPALMIASQWWRTRNGAIEYQNEKESKVIADVGTLFNYALKHGLVYKDSVGNYVVAAITNKRDATKDANDQSITKFVADYLRDDINRNADGSLKVEGNLFERVKEKFRIEECMIYAARGGYTASNEEAAIILLRKQMKLLQKLRDEVAYYKENFLKPVEKEIRSDEKLRQQKAFAKYVLFDIVFEENNTWKYKLGSETYPLVAKHRAAEEHKDYLEMAACEALWQLENFPTQKNYVERAVLDIQDKIACRSEEGDGTILFAAMKEKYNALSARCHKIILGIQEKTAMGKSLTKEEESRYEFYNVFSNTLDILLNDF